MYKLGPTNNKSDSPTLRPPVDGTSQNDGAIVRTNPETEPTPPIHKSIPYEPQNTGIPINDSATTEQESRIPTPPKGKIDIKSGVKRVSGLSLSSLKAKKEHQLNKKEAPIDESNLPKNEFTEAAMQKHWADFVDILDKGGRKILASNLHADIPKLMDNFTIRIELPNGTMKKEVEREKYDLMEYLKQKLHNHFITLKINVNEATAKKFAFTPEEKYEKLREKNPAIDLLRKEFDLDL